MDDFRTLARIGALLLVAGCAAPPPKAAPEQITTTAPRCAGERQCAAMWLQAQETLQALTGMRLRIVTDTRLETFAATGYGRMAGSVLKWPTDAGHELRVRFECYGGVDCADLRNSATNVFNRTIAAQ